jgi:hypothetical protein
MGHRKLPILPVACRVDFGERIIDVFGRQFLTPASITGHNILQILFALSKG